MADRCFVAVEPPAELVAALRALERPERPGLRWTGEGQWHVTLKFLPAVDRHALVAALDAWAATPGFPGAEAVAGPAPRALSRRVWMLPVQGLDALAAAVGVATAGVAEATGAAGEDGAAGEEGAQGEQGAAGEEGAGDVDAASEERRAGRPARPFRGHLTLARARRPSALRHLARPEITARWRVPELVAVRSELTSDGALHQVLGRWRLPA